MKIPFLFDYCSFYLGNMSNSQIYNTRNAAMNQEICGIKKYFMKSLDILKLDINDTFNNINDKLVTSKLGL